MTRSLARCRSSETRRALRQLGLGGRAGLVRVGGLGWRGFDLGITAGRSFRGGRFISGACMALHEWIV